MADAVVICSVPALTTNAPEYVLVLFKNKVPAALVIGPVKVFTPVRFNVPVPFLVRPPFALPASSGTDTVTLLFDESMMAPPARTLACIPPENHVVVWGVKFACSVPPLKLKTAFDPVLEATLKVESVPPF